MKVKEFEKEKIYAPFMGASMKYVPGQDPMGLLNTGERTFIKLLPGLNGVTDRIRLYSFYCWFFDFYSREIRIQDKDVQAKYLRRSEYILALIAAKNKWTGISGITEADKRYNDEDASFSLTIGTGEDKGTTEETYWKHPRGVFGQNYSSSMSSSQIGLVRETEENSKIYIRTNFDVDDRISGLQLAKAFHENIGDSAADVFISSVKEGVVSGISLEMLSEKFTMLTVPENTEEHRLLWEILTGPDLPMETNITFYRKETIKWITLLIEQGDKLLTDRIFTSYAYQSKGYPNHTYNETIQLWYYYQLEQYWHMVCTGGLHFFLEAMQEQGILGWINEKTFITALSESVKVEFSKFTTFTKMEDFYSLHSNGLDEDMIVSRMNKSKSSTEGLVFCFILLRTLINNNEDQIEVLLERTKKYQIGSQSSFISSFEELKNDMNLQLEEFITKFIRKYIVIRHQVVALNRMIDTQSVEKFIREDGLIRLISVIGYDYSSPRINSVLSFLRDLNLISRNAPEFTETGRLFFNELRD